MDEYESARLRVQCLELAKSIAVASSSGFYSVVSDAEKYWAFVNPVSPTDTPPPQTPKRNDDIPF